MNENLEAMSEQSQEGTKPNIGCEECRDVVERTDVLHVVRKCPRCGREMHVFEPGPHGIGMQVREGDVPTIPAGWLRLSLNPLQSTGQFYEFGLKRFGEGIFLGQLPEPAKRDTMDAEFAAAEAQCLEALRRSPLLTGLNPESEADAAEILDRVKDQRDRPEFWIVQELIAIGFGREALKDGAASASVWATVLAERFRSVRIYRESIEPAVWMGQSAKRLIDFLRLWDAHKNNGDEEFWQIMFNQHSYVLPQMFSVPAVLIGDKAYVGGMAFDRKEARFVDYLFAGETSKDALLVEIKTPVKKLLGPKYRPNVYKPSAELSGAIVQILDYRRQLLLDLNSINREAKRDITYFRPRCLLLIGNGATELENQEKRQSFELFRAELHDVEVVTFDELFRKIEALANLFNLVRQSPNEPAPKTS